LPNGEHEDDPGRGLGVVRPVGACVARRRDNEAGLRFVPLGVGKSVVIDLPRDVKDVLVADPAIANAVVRSTRRAYVIGVKVGQTNVFFFDAEGRQIAGFDIAVKRDLNGVQAELRKLLPGADIRTQGVGDGVLLAGAVASGQSQQPWTSPPSSSATSTGSSTASSSRATNR
jgi:pilus assembly protein CpaC